MATVPLSSWSPPFSVSLAQQWQYVATPGTGGSLILQWSPDGVNWNAFAENPFKAPSTGTVPPGAIMVRAMSVGALGTLTVGGAALTGGGAVTAQQAYNTGVALNFSGRIKSYLSDATGIDPLVAGPFLTNPPARTNGAAVTAGQVYNDAGILYEVQGSGTIGSSSLAGADGRTLTGSAAGTTSPEYGLADGTAYVQRRGPAAASVGSASISFAGLTTTGSIWAPNLLNPTTTASMMLAYGQGFSTLDVRDTNIGFAGCLPWDYTLANPPDSNNGGFLDAIYQHLADVSGSTPYVGLETDSPMVGIMLASANGLSIWIDGQPYAQGLTPALASTDGAFYGGQPVCVGLLDFTATPSPRKDRSIIIIPAGGSGGNPAIVGILIDANSRVRPARKLSTPIVRSHAQGSSLVAGGNGRAPDPQRLWHWRASIMSGFDVHSYWGGSGTGFYSDNYTTGAAFYATIAGNVLTVSSIIASGTPATASSCTINGTALTLGGTTTGTWAVGMIVTNGGVARGTVITAGSGSNWTVNISQKVGPGAYLSGNTGAGSGAITVGLILPLNAGQGTDIPYPMILEQLSGSSGGTGTYLLDCAPIGAPTSSSLMICGVPSIQNRLAYAFGPGPIGTPPQYDLITLEGLINDGGCPTAALLQSTILSVLRGVRALQPNAHIELVGCLTSPSYYLPPNALSAIQKEQAAYAAFQQFNDTNSSWIPAHIGPYGELLLGSASVPANGTNASTQGAAGSRGSVDVTFTGTLTGPSTLGTLSQPTSWPGQAAFAAWGSSGSTANIVAFEFDSGDVAVAGVIQGTAALATRLQSYLSGSGSSKAIGHYMGPGYSYSIIATTDGTNRTTGTSGTLPGQGGPILLASAWAGQTGFYMAVATPSSTGQFNQAPILLINGSSTAYAGANGWNQQGSTQVIVVGIAALNFTAPFVHYQTWAQLTTPWAGPSGRCLLVFPDGLCRGSYISVGSTSVRFQPLNSFAYSGITSATISMIGGGNTDHYVGGGPGYTDQTHFNDRGHEAIGRWVLEQRRRNFGI
jgi:hypothetical protein